MSLYANVSSISSLRMSFRRLLLIFQTMGTRGSKYRHRRHCLCFKIKCTTASRELRIPRCIEMLAFYAINSRLHTLTTFFWSILLFLHEIDGASNSHFDNLAIHRRKPYIKAFSLLQALGSNYMKKPLRSTLKGIYAGLCIIYQQLRL